MQGWCEHIKGDVNSASGENWKEDSSSTISTEALFYSNSNEENLNEKENLKNLVCNNMKINIGYNIYRI